MCRYKTCRCELSIVARHAAVRDRSAATVDMATYLGPRDQSEMGLFVFYHEIFGHGNMKKRLLLSGQ